MRSGVANLRQQLEAAFAAGHVQVDVPLGPFTTFKVGGPADLFFEPRSSDISAGLKK